MSGHAASLPQELFHKVLGHTLTQVPSTTAGAYEVGDLDIKVLCTMSLVNRSWNAAIRPTLYSRWTYHDTEHPFSQVWSFLRTVLQNPQNSAFVQTMDIRKYGLDLSRDRRPKHDINLSSEDRTSINNALNLAGLCEMKSTIYTALDNNNCIPLMALLMTSLPNLKTMSLVIGEVDACFTRVLDLAIRDDSNHPEHRAFQNLKEANLRTSTLYEGGASNFCTENVLPMYQLPCIQRLSIFDYMPQDANSPSIESVEPSPVTDLILAPCANWTITLAAARKMISLPKTLVNLSFYFDDDITSSSLRDKPISNAELWGLLFSHRHSLKYLDIYRDCEGISRPNHHSANSHMGLLRDFSSLKTLLIQPEVLLGGCCHGEKAPFPLRETLPEVLESLTFYGNEGLAANRELEEQLVELVQDKEFTDLKCIVLEDVRKVLKHFTYRVKLPRHRLEQACDASGCRLRTVDKYDALLPKGGSRLPYTGATKEGSNTWHSSLSGLGSEPGLIPDRVQESDHEVMDYQQPFEDSTDEDDDMGDESDEDSSTESDDMGASDDASDDETQNTA